MRQFVGIDIGTYKVRCVIGVLDPENSSKISIIGHGEHDSRGMRKGQITSADELAESISQAVNDAERISGIHIGEAFVNVNGASVQGMDSSGVIAISTANREITIDDRIRVEDAASIVRLPSNREIIQVFAKNYRLDGQENIKDPVGMRGVRLEVDTHIITAPSPNLRNLDLALEKAGIKYSNRTVSGLACAEATLSRQQKEAGALVIDIGASTTNIAVIEDGEVQHVAVLPAGGNNITNDLAIGLETDLVIAEKVKLEHGALGKEARKSQASVEHDGKTYSFDLKGDIGVYNIIEARVDDILEWVSKELHKIKRYQKLPGGIVVVGGTAQMPGIAEAVKDKLHLSTHVGEYKNVSGLVDNVKTPAFASAIGLTILDMLLGPDDSHRQIGESRGIFSGISNIFGRIK